MSDAALITGLLSNSIRLINYEFLSFWCCSKEEIGKLSSTLIRISLLLKEAERRKLEENDTQTRDWLQKVNDAAYKVRDIMDECISEQFNHQKRNSSMWQVTNLFANLFTNNTSMTSLNIAQKIKDVQEEIDQIYSDCEKLHLCETSHDTKCNAEIHHSELLSQPNYNDDDDCWVLFEERAFKNGTPKTQNFIDIGREIARKCNGVPLLAKILGSQLGFKNDEIEWCKIRDSNVWVISQNEDSILPILRMSYYDLPYHLRRCFAYCAIFPKNILINKDELIQMWIAHDLILTNGNQEEVEDVGNIIWDELCSRSFLQDKTETTCGIHYHMHYHMHDLAQDIMEGEYCIMGATSTKSVSEQKIRHMTVMDDRNLDKAPFLYPDKIGCRKSLQSIILYHTNFHSLNVLNEIFSDSKKYLSLRVLHVHPNVPNITLPYVGCLKHLRYLNLSLSRITALPDSICCLFNLQTLNLSYNNSLESLPRNTKDLINLRHLHLKGCSMLQFMPAGMEQLKRLKTLSLFVIGKETDHCQLDELKEMDIRGSLEIGNLERVSDTSIARWKISFADKKLSINDLELHWSFNKEDNDTKKRHEVIGETLELPTTTTRLNILRISGYKGVNLPKLVEKSSSSLTYLVLWFLKNLNHIFTINNNMKNAAASSEDTGIVVFPLLEKLEIRGMTNLTELFSPIPSPNCCSITRAFPNLREIEIFYCPKLQTLPPHLKSVKDVTLWGHCSDELIYSISNLSGLTHLILYELRRSVLFPSGNNEAQFGRSSFQSLRHMKIMRSFMLSYLFDEGMIMQLPLLQTLHIHDCKKLVSLGVMNLHSLTKLHIEDCPELMLSLDQFGNLNNSLQSLYIKKCPKLVLLEEEDDVIALLSSLRARLGPNNFHVDFLKEEEEVQTLELMAIQEKE